MAVSTPALPVPFDVFLTQVERAAPAVRPALVEMFWQRLEQTPLVEGNTAAVFLYHGDARTVGLLGDLGGDRALPLRRIDGTALWYRRVRVERAARLEYTFVVDGHAGPLGTPDARNPYRVVSGQGVASELVMPGYVYPEVFAPFRDGTPASLGGLAAHRLPAGVLPYEHEVSVYTPPGYAQSADRYPTLTFLNGRDYVAFGHVPAVLDWLTERGEIEPVVAVFLDAPDGTPAYGLDDAAVAFLADELVPTVDARYRTRAAAADRLLVGNAYGGLMAAYGPIRRPGVFGKGYGQSGVHSFQADRLVRFVETETVSPVQLYLDVGTYERSVGALPDAEADALAANRRLRAALQTRGYDLSYAEYPEGHSWGSWRTRLAEALPTLFPGSQR